MFKKNKIKDQAIVKVLIVPVRHPAYTKLAILRRQDNVLVHALWDGWDWLLCDVLTLQPSSTGMLRAQDVDQISHIVNLSEFINDVTVSRAIWREIEQEIQIVLDSGRV